ncbi:MAG: hypothetical protein KDD90_00675 [Sphingomonadaceae bacterium]|nr:hypothetical protein [Sphingomonadaceae bacterium]
MLVHEPQNPIEHCIRLFKAPIAPQNSRKVLEQGNMREATFPVELDDKPLGLFQSFNMFRNIATRLCRACTIRDGLQFALNRSAMLGIGQLRCSWSSQHAQQSGDHSYT